MEIFLNKYTCHTCTTRVDCAGAESQAVLDVSKRCGLICHSRMEGMYLISMKDLKSAIDLLDDDNISEERAIEGALGILREVKRSGII